MTAAPPSRRWTWALIGVAHVLSFFAGAWFGEVIFDSPLEDAVEAEQRAVTAHRIRNEQSHDCTVRFLRDIVAAIVDATEDDQPFVPPENDCPPPLTEDQIRRQLGAHEDEP